MANNPYGSSMDEGIRNLLLAGQAEAKRQREAEEAEAAAKSDPRGKELSADSITKAQEYLDISNLMLDSQGRDLAEFAQDAGAGLMGTLGGIGTTAILGATAATEGVVNLLDPGKNNWDATQDALELVQSTNDYWQSLKSRKTKAFQELSQYRQQRAVQQAEEEAYLEGGEAGAVDRITAEMGTAVKDYLTNPSQIASEAIAQLPYLLTGGLAKGATESARLGQPLVRKLIQRGMTEESATKLVQMGIVGSSQGTIEGASAAAQAYQRVMDSTVTFSPEEEADREMAALKAAGEAFVLAGASSAITGTLASKWELSPFTAKGSSALARTGDNAIKALLEGGQETVESGMSQFASNLAGNRVLMGADQVNLDEGVGGAAGTGLVVGAGSTVVTNPRAGVDAALVPASLAGKGLGVAGSRAAAAQRRADLNEVRNAADDIVANVTTPASAAVAQEGLTVDTPADQVEFPPEIDTRNVVSAFATGMKYLEGKDMNSKDAVMAFHVLGMVLSHANIIQRLREGTAKDAADESLSPEDQAKAKDTLNKLDTIIDNTKLDQWVADFPAEQLEESLETLKEHPEAMGGMLAHMAARNPMRLTKKLINQALESKTLPEEQRQSLLLAKELKEAEAELQVGPNPDMSEVSRSIMHTGFPGASERKPSIGHMVADVTSALDQNDPESAQALFNRLVNFARYMDAKATRFEQAKTEIAESGKPRVEIPEYHRFHEGKLDENKPAFLTNTPKSLALPAAIRRDAEMVKKVVSALQKRTGLEVKTPPKASGKPSKAAPAKPAPVEQPKQETPQKVSEPAPEQAAPAQKETTEEEEVDELSQISDEALDQEITTLSEKIRRRRKNDTANAIEQDIRYNNLVREKARRVKTSPEPALKKAVDKPVGKKPAPKAEPVAAPVDIQMEPETPTSKPQTEATLVFEEQEEAAPAPVEEQSQKEEVSEPSRNHFTDLQPSYPVAEGATMVERNDALNHLAHSFTSSERPGLRSKGEALSSLKKLLEVLQPKQEDMKPINAIYATKEKLLARLQKLIGSGGPAKAKFYLSNNLWKEAKHHYLYATKWDPEKGVRYEEQIAQIMAWTGVQHMLDMATPMSWSNDLLQQMEETYGGNIRERMLDGWVPLKDQTEELARKLQINLELKLDKKVPVEYTEGTMLALAGRIIEAMIHTPNYNGVLEHETLTTLQVKDNNGKVLREAFPVQWVRMSVSKEGETGDLLFEAARIMEDFLPERATSNQAHVGEAPKNVNPRYRNSQQEISKEQKKALKRRNEKWHKLSPLLHNMWTGVLQVNRDQFFRLFGMDPAVKDFPDKKQRSVSQVARRGAYNTTFSDLKTILEHLKKVKDYAEEHEQDIYSVPSFFEYEQVTNGRAMTKGTSPQSSKWYREIFANAQYEVDPAKENKYFKLAVAQGLGIKLDTQSNQEALSALGSLLAHPDMRRALEAATRLGDKFNYRDNATLLEEDISAIEKLAVSKSDGGLGIELSPHAMTSLLHYAQYMKGKPFTSSLMFEIDGKTDGPINLMMLMGLTGSVESMGGALALAGTFFGDEPISVQDMTETIKSWNGNSKDLYEIITNGATKNIPRIYNEVMKEILDKTDSDKQKKTQQQVGSLMKATLHLVKLADLGKGDALKLSMEFERAFSKKSTQAAGYLQGMRSVSGDLLDSILEAVSAKMDAGTLTEFDKQAIDTFFSYALGRSRDKAYFNSNPKAYRDEHGNKWVWDGKPLNHRRRMTARATISTFIGEALFDSLINTIGTQRNHMMAAVTLMQHRVAYADYVLRTRYKAKQAELVKAGELHPGQALSKVDEEIIAKEIWKTLVPHPVLRNTAGLPVASIGRHNGNPLTAGIELSGSRRIENRYFDKTNNAFSHYAGLTEAMFEDPGVSFAALSIMAGGDGSMMTGLFSKTMENVLDMYDGLYVSPEIVEQMADALNQEVKANWEHDFIGAILDSLPEDPGYKAWADKQERYGQSFSEMDAEATAMLREQRELQITTLRDINSRPHSVSHMAGSRPAFFPAVPLNSTTLGTSQTDPLLDLAADSLGQVSNGIRKLSAAEVKALLQEHTFENPVLSGLWKVLAPLVNDDLLVYLSSDKVGMAEFYKQNERREMGTNVDGVSVGNRVYIRAINAETLVHELLHATTKNLTATYFAQPGALSAQQQAAMKNLLALQAQFLEMDISEFPDHQRAMIEHVRAVMRTLDPNSAMQEFLAYGLTNYHLQRSLKATKSKLGQLVEGVFNAVKALFGFPNGTQSDSMLAQMFSNFALLTEEARDTVYPVSVDEALNSIGMAQRFGEILTELERVVPTQDALVASQRAHTISRAVGARADGRTRMQALADTNLFPKLTNEQMSAAEYVQALFSAGLQFKASENALLAHVVDAVRQAGPVAWRDNSDPNDQEDIDRAQARYDYFFQDNTKHDQVADILSMYLVSPEFAKYMDQQVLPRKKIDKTTFDGLLDSVAAVFYEKSDARFGLSKGATLGKALETAAERLHKSMLQSAKRKQTSDKVGPYRKMQEKLTEGIQFLGEKAGKLSEKQLAANRTVVGNTLMVLAGVANNRYADMVGGMVLSMTNEMEKFTPFREVMQEMVGTNPSNYQLIKLKGVAARMISAIRQSFREQVPVTVKGWFNNLTEEQDELLHKVIGKMAIYSLSQDLKDRMEEILTDPTNAKLEAEATLMSSGNRTQRMLMIKYAKHLGDQMALKGNQAIYQNTRAIEGLAAHGGGHRLSEAEFAALENLSTLQALSHLTPNQRRQILSLFRDNTDGFWKTTALINAYVNLDTQRAGKFSASLNFQKGYIPVETDNRKKLKLFQPSEVRNAERKGWVKVGEAKDGSGLVYMATTVGKIPTLSGGAIHAVDMHMNGVHYHSGLPTDPSIQTLITHPKQVREIMQKIANGGGSGYVALYDAAGDLEGFQRRLDPVLVDRHTKTVGRISDAAGIWLGRLHEERFAHERNQAAADLLRKTWDEAKADKRESEFVNIRQPYDPASKGHQKVDKVLQNVWNTLPYHTKRQLEAAFADGSQNPPIWIRRDQLNDAIGYHKASVGNFFTGDNRYEKSTNDNVAALARQVLGKDAYKYLVMAEEGWQALVGSAKDTIIVKSLVVALNNLASNQTQLLMVTGNPVWNLRVQAQKHRELVAYLNYQQRIARLTAEGLASSDARTKAKIDSEQAFLKREMRKLSIYPLIEAGELPSIAEGLSEIEEFSMVGDFTAWMEKQMGKMPPAARTVLRNLAVSKETSLYKGLDRMIQYGDFVAKATMYEWLTTQDKAARKEALDMVKTAPVNAPVKFADALHELALKEINDEFVNYARLPGRWRTYGEDMGLLWFYNYKLRIMKMTFRRMRKNPFAFLVASYTGGLLGIDTLVDTLPWNVNFDYATGIDPLFSAHQSVLWTQMF